jgi:hypothetical protein
MWIGANMPFVPSPTHSPAALFGPLLLAVDGMATLVPLLVPLTTEYVVLKVLDVTFQQPVLLWNVHMLPTYFHDVLAVLSWRRTW